MGTRAFIFVLRHGIGVLLLLFSVLVFLGLLHAFLTDEEVQNEALFVVLVVGGAWWLYTSLPSGIRQAGRFVWRTAKRIVRGR